MFEIIYRSELADGLIVVNEISAPRIARKTQPGQFVILKANETGERIPLTVSIPAFVKAIAEGDHDQAIRIIRGKNSLPAVCGRVCPQEIQCEGECVLGKKGEPLATGNLERFAADYARMHGGGELPEKAPSTGRKVAIVGSGPAGLTVAGDLLLKGRDVTMMEAFQKPGDVLSFVSGASPRARY